MRLRLLWTTLALTLAVGAANAAAATTGGTSLATLLAQPHVFFTSKVTKGGTLGVADYASPGSDNVVTSFKCQQVDFAGGRGVCLKTVASKASPFMGFVFDSHLHFLRRFRVAGSPLGVRVRSDGLVAAYTIGAYLSRDQVTGPPDLTRVWFVELQSGNSVPIDLFTVLGLKREPTGQRVYADVTFDSAHLNSFFVSMTDGPHKYLMQGDWTRRTLKVLRRDGKLPSLSPDGTQLAYVTTTRPSRLVVLNLSSGRSHVVADGGPIATQPTWLDRSRLLYAVATNGQDALWTMRADGTGKPALFMKGAASPSVVVDPNAKQ